MGRSFRVGWGPGGQLILPGAAYAPSLLQQQQQQHLQLQKQFSNPSSSSSASNASSSSSSSLTIPAKILTKDTVTGKTALVSSVLGTARVQPPAQFTNAHDVPSVQYISIQRLLPSSGCTDAEIARGRYTPLLELHLRQSDYGSAVLDGKKTLSQKSFSINRY
jgi:hypothetical protein